MKGYLTGDGYIGFLLNGKKMLFASEDDYRDYYRALEDRPVSGKELTGR